MYVCLVLLLTIKLSLLVDGQAKYVTRNPRVKNTIIAPNRAKTPVLTHADHIQHVISREQP